MMRLVPLLALLGVAAALAPRGSAEEKDKGSGTIKLFNGRDLSGWKTYLDPAKNGDPEKIWTVKDGMIICEGSIFGYLLTEKEYGDYVLRLQWRWGEKG